MKIYAEGNCFIVDRENGARPEPYSKAVGRIRFGQMSGTETVSVIDQVNEVLAACQIKKLKDDSAETDSTGTVTLNTGAAGQVSGITVNGVQIMSGAVVFDTSLTITAANVVKNINAFQKDYIASSVGAVITITGTTYNKTDTNTFAVVSTVVTLTKTDVNMSGGVSAVISDSGNADTDYLAVRQYLTAFIG